MLQTTDTPGHFSAPRSIGYFLLVCLAIMAVRSIWTFPVIDSDALTKTYFAAEIYRSGDWSLLLHNHHTMRWIEMVPQVLLHHAVGLRYELFYFLPLLVYSLYVTVLLFVLRSELKPGELLLLLALLFVEPLAFRTSSQLLNPPFGVLFAVLGVILLVKLGKKSNKAVAGAAVVFVLAYAAHASYLAFAAGGLAWLVFIQRSVGKSAVFLVTIFACLVVETLVFNGLSGSDLTLGRLEALAGTPGVQRQYEGFVGSPGLGYLLFERWRDLPRFDLALSVIFFIAAAWLILWRKALKVPDIVIGLCLAGLAYAVLSTITPVRLDPIWPLVPIRSRYLTSFLPFAMVTVVYAMSIMLRRDSRASRLLPVLVAAALALTLVFSPGAFNYPKDYLVVIRPEAFAWRSHNIYMDLADRVRLGQVVISGYSKASNSYVVLYRYPLKLKVIGGGLGVEHVQENAMCLFAIDRVPFSHNYFRCQR